MLHLLYNVWLAGVIVSAAVLTLKPNIILQEVARDQGSERWRNTGSAIVSRMFFWPIVLLLDIWDRFGRREKLQ